MKLGLFVLSAFLLSAPTRAAFEISKKDAVMLGFHERMPSGERKANLAIGPSAPDTDPEREITSVIRAKGGGPSRFSGGEVIGFAFYNAKNEREITIPVRKVKVIAYSKSGKGKILMRTVLTRPDTPEKMWNPLTRFASMEEGSHAENHRGDVLLANGDSVTVTLSKEIKFHRMLMTLEGFANSDASVIVQLDTSFENGAVAVGFGRAVVKDFEPPVDEPTDPGTFPGNPNPRPDPEPEPKPQPPPPHHKKCEGPSDCKGFANSCFAGRCTQPGYFCDGPDDCPGFANSCFAGKCSNQTDHPCEKPEDCKGFANSCFAGKCTNP